MFTRINGRLIRLIDIGSGPRTLVTHGGWTGNWELWEQQATLLSKQGWRVIAFDHRGSGPITTAPDAITMDDLVEDLVAVLDQCDVRTCVLAGESMGSLVVERAAVDFPERFTHLVIVAGAARFPKGLRLRAFGLGLRTMYRLTLRIFVRMALPERDCGTHHRRWGLSILRQARPSAARRLYQLLAGADQRDVAAGITVPTLVIHGTWDLIVPHKYGRELATLIPGAEFLSLRGAGHVPTITRPEQIVAAIERFTMPLEDVTVTSI